MYLKVPTYYARGGTVVCNRRDQCEPVAITPMELRLAIIEVDYQSDQSLLVNFNDGTYAFFSVSQLAALQPHRLVGEGESAEVGQ